MRTVFDLLTRLSLRFRGVVFLLVILVLILGVVAGTQLKQELVPPVEFPSTFILAQASGLSSEQVLRIITERIEAELSQIPELVNIESQTTGSFGAFITASNDFGLDQAALQQKIQTAIDRVWFPNRQIAPAVGVSAADFAADLLNDLSPEVLLYFAQRNSDFLFQLSPTVWAQLSDETLETLVAYLAYQTQSTNRDASALELLVNQEIAPQLNNSPLIANVVVNGGQTLPDEVAENIAVIAMETTARPALLQLSQEVKDVILSRIDLIESFDPAAIDQLRGMRPMPDRIVAPPELPQIWRMDHFKTATDLLELQGLNRTVANVLNEFARTGRIKGALGQTDDITPETLGRMLAIDPSILNYFKSEHLVALSPEVFAALPEEYIRNLDGRTRDALAAASLALSVTGMETRNVAQDLPAAWRIQPPQIITFSFADLPLATYSIFTTSTVDVAAVQQPSANENMPETENVTATPAVDGASTATPESVEPGPALPQLFALAGSFFGVELVSADDLLAIELQDLPGAVSGSRLNAAQFFNTLALLGQVSASGQAETAGFAVSDLNPIQLAAGLQECGIGLSQILDGSLDIGASLISCVDADVWAYLLASDSGFAGDLQSSVLDLIPLEILLEVDGLSPRLGEVWQTLAAQPQFRQLPLRSLDDLIALGDGRASSVLNTIDETVPDQFAGYEVRLFDSITPLMLSYITAKEQDFWQSISPNVVVKFAPETLGSLSQEALDGLDDGTRATVLAITQDEVPSAAEQVADLYRSATAIPPTDPEAPALGPDWQFISQFINGVDELNNASDLLRFPAVGNPAAFMNSFLTGQGASLAPSLMGSLTPDAFTYIAARSPNFVRDLEPGVLQLLSQDTFAILPEEVQARANETERFVPATQITRTNGAPSLLVTLYKTADANTIEAFYAADAIIRAIDAQNPNIEVQIAFEQSSFIEESISGVIREGTLGAFFAVINILVFLSGGVWGMRGRRITGAVVIALSAIFLILLVTLELEGAGGNWQTAWENANVLLRVIGILGILAGLAFITWRGVLPYPSWRSTLVIAVSIPMSILAALALMNWVPPVVNEWLKPYAADSPIIQFVLRLFPASLTLNIMTLSGLTVAIGRVVDDSIVVLENIFRQIQSGMDKREAILTGTRDVSVAIFSATSIAVVVFLPLGLTGGLIGEFFLPFGLAVTYALATSFLVAITVVPALAYLFIDQKDVPEEQETWMQRAYVPILRWVLRSTPQRVGVILLAIASVGLSVVLFSSRPAAFLPDFGEPQISATVSLPSGTSILSTNELVLKFETALRELIPADEINTVRSSVGGGGLSFATLIAGSGVSENAANITVTLRSQARMEQYTREVRQRAEEIFGSEYVVVSSESLSSSGFGGFELVVSGPDQAVLEALDAQIILALETVEGLTNISSNLQQAAASDGGTSAVTYIRSNGTPALSYTGELETENTLGVTNIAIDTILQQVELPPDVIVGQGFNSRLQQEGFLGLFVAMGIAITIVVIILLIVFRSPVYWIALILSIVVAPVGAAIALSITGRVLGISALIGLLMLLGLVVTNAVVLIDRVGSNRVSRAMSLHDALIEAGSRRLRPIIMTALATVIALIPLSLGLSEGAIIAAELGTVVIGGIISSTLLTLLVTPAAYYLLTPVHEFLVRRRK